MQKKNLKSDLYILENIISVYSDQNYKYNIHTSFNWKHWTTHIKSFRTQAVNPWQRCRRIKLNLKVKIKNRTAFLKRYFWPYIWFNTSFWLVSDVSALRSVYLICIMQNDLRNFCKRSLQKIMYREAFRMDKKYFASILLRFKIWQRKR